MEFLNEFEVGKRYVFDKDIYIEFMITSNIGYDSNNECEEYWTNCCNNKFIEIEDRRLGIIKIGESNYETIPEWCREVPSIRLLTENDL